MQFLAYLRRAASNVYFLLWMATGATTSTIVRNLEGVQSRIVNALSQCNRQSDNCRLVAVSKTKSVQEIQAAYAAGQRHFGENYIQELVSKAPELPQDIQWHFIGHLQSNKAKTLLSQVPNLFMIETVDTPKLANLLNKQLAGTSNRLKIMIQVNTSGEEQKHGIAPGECPTLAQHIVSSCPHLELCGLMTIGRLGETAPECFECLLQCRETLIAQGISIPEMSMGMSGDFETAISLGSTNVRVGSTIFGARQQALK